MRNIPSVHVRVRACAVFIQVYERNNLNTQKIRNDKSIDCDFIW